MNKTAIKNFAIWARKKLIEDITYKAGLIGVSAKGIAQPLPQSSGDLQFFDIGTKEYAKVSGKEIEQRNALVKALQDKEKTSDYKTAFNSVIEEIAYTWFNRMIAVRFMEVNGYLPSGIRVLSSENPAKNEPDFVTNPFDTDMDFSAEEQDRIIALKDENKLDELFRMLFIKQCNKLHEILPELFEKTSDYTELLLNISFTDKDGVVNHLVHDINEDDFNVEKEGQVEIIGWLYQYYNTELKDETFADLKKNIKISKEKIPAATQLFTPDWIVRYMVENSLGRLWIEHRKAERESGTLSFVGANVDAHQVGNTLFINNADFEPYKNYWKYYLDEAEQESEVEKQLKKNREELAKLTLEGIKVIDPCMGSGHILVYCFDVLMQIYESMGYTQRDAAQSILKNNIYGLDIDNRAAQLSYFAVMMKARQYDRRIFTRDIRPNVFAIEESNNINRAHIKYFGENLSTLEKHNAQNQMSGVLDVMHDAKEYGSILNVEDYDWDLLERFANDIEDVPMSFETVGIEETQHKLLKLIKIAKVMAQKYHTVVTNPPYMGASGMSTKLSQYVKDKYPDSKSDLFAVFIEHCGVMAKKNGYQAMITQHAWMFLSSYERLREKMLLLDTVNMAHLGPRAFEEIGGEVVQTTSFVLRNSNTEDYKGKYCRLIEPTTQQGKEEKFLAKENQYDAKQANFSKIPGSPIAYWWNEKIIGCFDKNVFIPGNPMKGIQTGKGEKYLRYWFEPSIDKTGFDIISHENMIKSKLKWFPLTSGGLFRKWYGNFEMVVNLENNGFDIRSTGLTNFRLKDPKYYFLEGLTWTEVTTKAFTCRYLPKTILFGNGGPVTFFENDKLLYTIGLLNSVVSKELFTVLAPTMNYGPDQVRNIPYRNDYEKQCISLVQDNIEISKNDWDSFETSWDFKVHPLVALRMSGAFAWGDNPPVMKLSSAYKAWETLCEGRFNQLKANEEELNKIFIDIYGLQDELTPEVEDKDVTVRKADLGRDIRSLISYAVGCMFGRYSLDCEGLAFAGGEWDESKYKTFVPDADNCIPITDEDYLEDDIVGRFVNFIKVVYGEDTLEENLTFIANALGNKGATSRDVIRNYFLNDFIKDHIKIYQKRPIYWMFDSGKQNGFKALVYMHRWNADTVGNLRVEYLHKMQHIYENEINRMQDTIDNSSNARDVSAAMKRKDKLQKQLKETRDYDAMIANIALSRIDIDLDDGVKVNYEKVQTAKDGKKMQVLAKI